MPGEGLLDMSGGRAEFGATLCLKPEVELANVVERSQDGESGSGDIVKVVSARQARQARAPERE